MNKTEIRQAIKTAMDMSPVQLNYVSAKALYDKVKARVEAETAPVNYAVRHGNITDEQWADRVTEIERLLNYWTITDRLIDAENDLIAWAKDSIKTYHPDRYEALKEAFERPVCLPKLRQKLIDICMRARF